ncbi:MAG: Fe-S cluster assembly protein SufB [Acholeplasmatales bacterium]|jgi:Fe-S cluster assembly protein SufB|nr:Fe-S cluster assembly protein SufB [Acholeplasmatales bacterium]
MNIDSIKTKPLLEFDKGISLEKVKLISVLKNEPLWMYELRVKSYSNFKKLKNPKWGVNLQDLDFSKYTYFKREVDKVKSSWEDVPSNIKDTFERLGIPEAEREFLAGVSTQFESEVVYHSETIELEKKGVIFLDADTALQKHEELFKKYFSKLVAIDDNKYAALNSSCWSGGSFIYVPKGVKLEKPLQSYFRINANRMGQFERTLIIVDDDASLSYIEGCTAPIYSDSSLHAAVVEIYVGKNAKCRYTTIQNWSNDVINLVTKRAIVDDFGTMEWIDGNIGSGINMKYPACILKGDYAKGLTISIAFAGKGQIQDAGCKMIHLGKNTSSNIIAKSVAKDSGIVNYRGLVKIDEKATNSKSHIECDTLLLDDISKSSTIPSNIVLNNNSEVEHEATVSKISIEQLFYLESRGLSEIEANEVIVMGFLEPFSRELPMEYAVELNRLIKLDMSKSTF